MVMRHAKAEQWGESDRARELTERGEADAAEAGLWLKDQGFTPDAALVSDAARTRRTWEAMAGAAGWGIQPEFDPALYDASSDSVLDLVRLIDDSVERLIVIGHNPTMAYLAQMLDDGEGDVPLELPTSGLVVFEYDAPWADLGFGDCRCVADHVGRG